MTLDKYKIELLVRFFESDQASNWKVIAYKLIEDGKFVVPKDYASVRIGGVANFIKHRYDLPNHINCVEYQFNVDEFIGSRFFQDSLPGHINSVTQEIKNLKSQLKEKEEQLKSIKELQYEKIP